MTRGVPRKLGRYEVAEVIGTGAFATVYRARDDRLDADVAIKVLAENHSFDADLRERFISEGHLLRRVDSPHVVKVFDLGETEAGQPFLVLDLAGGGDLAARRRRLGGAAPRLDELLTVARQVAVALGALHAEQVVHRDVTPGNLLVRGTAAVPPSATLLAPGERLMLADLGLSKDLAATSGLTVGAGTAGFTPPEQGVGGWVDARADIWSASALLVWLALGETPATHDAWQEPVRRLGWPDPVIRELERSLSAQADQRHPTAAAWIEALEAANAPPPAPTGPAAAAGPVDAAPRRPRRRGLAALAAAAVLLAGLAGGWWLGRSTADDDPYGRTSVEQLSGGRARATTTAGSSSVAFTGPRSATVGQTATFTAALEGVETATWLAPDGKSFPSGTALELRPTSEGTATVRLLGQTADGDVLVAVLRVEVRAAS
ncbi:serine/threonine protein kinase [Aquihabitans sp. G128]|uniref:serine/threonine-protein kinase n=1 Tax=Aquihabitans sp. G128 TaxID=2849779 RepID=UPI001C248AA6|nr:serine/threonine-protein kinase [Aquihabitans sp. G128]QXC60844.1 serine/threonine protein kinase [Aquihabitans sp. G128]